MKHASQTLALLCALLTFAAASHAKDDGHDKDRAAIKANYAAADKAISNKNVDGATAYIAPNYTDINGNGVVDVHNKEEQVALVHKLFAVAPDVSIHTTVTAITFDKRGANVLEKAVVVSTITQNGEKHASSDTGTYRDMWKKINGGWLEYHSQDLTYAPTVDGKPVK